MNTPDLLKAILEQYALRINGLHGVSHWARVLENGRAVAETNAANLKVVELFALFHDACRVNDGFDKGHGRRGAELAVQMRGQLFDISDQEFDLLYHACAYHTRGYTEADITVQTCWDADRLDLNRVGIPTDPARLCTPEAKAPSILRWADERARSRFAPGLIVSEWGLEGFSL